MSALLRVAVEGRPGEVRVAVVDAEGEAVSFAIERTHRRSQVGRVVLGRVTAVRNDIGAAFIDIGDTADGFLNLGKSERAEVREGMAVVVEVDRDADAGKGPRLRRADRDADTKGAVPRELSPPLGLAGRTVAQFGAERIAEIIVDDADLYAALSGAGVPCRMTAAGERAFHALDLDDAFNAALAPAVSLSGGGALTIDETAAMTTIDVDAGGRRAANPARLALDANLAAAAEIACQLRLRGIGGIVAVDFLKMTAKADRERVLSTLKDAVRDDPGEVQVAGFSPFGVVEMLRGRTQPSLAGVMLEGKRRLSAETVALQALDDVVGRRGTSARVRVAPAVAMLLDGALRSARAEAEARLGFDIRVEAVSHRAIEDYAIEDAT